MPQTPADAPVGLDYGAPIALIVDLDHDEASALLEVAIILSEQERLLPHIRRGAEKVRTALEAAGVAPGDPDNTQPRVH